MDEVQVSFVFLPFSRSVLRVFPLTQRLESRKGTRYEGRKKAAA